jgi:very-short-patch-repair endonuclease
VRCILIAAGLPEPALNVDVFDDSGRFLGCVDMAYPLQRVAIEYLGMLHDTSWARDVERIAALRAAGWNVIEVTSPLLARPEELVHRVRSALNH